MSEGHTIEDDVVYNMVSIQYHALQAAELYDKYIQDAHDHQDVADFIRECQSQDKDRARRAHELIKSLMHGPGGGH